MTTHSAYAQVQVRGQGQGIQGNLDLQLNARLGGS